MLYTKTSFLKALNHRLFLEKVHKVIKFNQNAWPKSYIDMNTDLRKNAKNYFEKDFFNLMNNVVFEKPVENVWKHEQMREVLKLSQQKKQRII